eukprot:6190446-Pleurochrysis_carterae.AAC.2
MQSAAARLCARASLCARARVQACVCAHARVRACARGRAWARVPPSPSPPSRARLQQRKHEANAVARGAVVDERGARHVDVEPRALVRRVEVLVDEVGRARGLPKEGERE